VARVETQHGRVPLRVRASVADRLLQTIAEPPLLVQSLDELFAAERDDDPDLLVVRGIVGRGLRRRLRRQRFAPRLRVGVRVEEQKRCGE
jgi:hypothetical protein